MTSILNHENGVVKEQADPIPLGDRGMAPRDNVMQAVVKLPTNGGQLSRVIPEHQLTQQEKSE
jgi:hypothetical protein